MFTFYSVSFILNSKMVLFLSHTFSLLPPYILTTTGGNIDSRGPWKLVLPILAAGPCMFPSIHSLQQLEPTLL